MLSVRRGFSIVVMAAGEASGDWAETGVRRANPTPVSRIAVAQTRLRGDESETMEQRGIFSISEAGQAVYG